VLESLTGNVRLFLVVFFRCFALMETAPLLSASTIPQMARVGLAFFAAAGVFPGVLSAGYPLPDSAVDYALVVVGEVLIGLTLGFLMSMFFAIFQTAGQFFSLQMGFGASEVFDPLAQVELPLMGELLNLVALLVFIAASGAGKFLYVGVAKSFASLRAVDLVVGRTQIVETLVRGLGGMFQSALTISFPILGSLLLVSITMGLLAKASPQIDVLMMGFPLSIGVAFLVMVAALPFLMGAFERIIDAGIGSVAALVDGLGRVAR
jgi:flagellar biosynthesis protein FliR